MPPAEPGGWPEPVTRRVVDAVAFVDASILANPLFEPHEAHAILVRHHNDHPEMPIRVTAATWLIKDARREAGRLGRLGDRTAHELIDALGWKALVLLHAPLEVVVDATAGPEDVSAGTCAALRAWADRDRRFWRDHGFVPWDAAIHVSAVPPDEPTFAEWERMMTQRGDPAALSSVAWHPDLALCDLVPYLRSAVDTARRAVLDPDDLF